MADWTDIPDATFEPGAPAKGRDMRFLRDNPIAIAEGAPGAPRIQEGAMGSNSVNHAAMKNSAAGTTIVCRLVEEPVNITQDPYAILSSNSAGTYSATILVGGQITVTVEHGGSGTLPGTQYVRVVRNTTQVVEWVYELGDPTASRSINVTVSRGDRIYVQARNGGSGTSTIRNAYIRAASTSPVVAA